jgi:hypothetical protein
MRIGPMLTSIAAVPASTSCSPQFSVIMYSPNHRSPEPRIPGQAARAGQRDNGRPFYATKGCGR